MAIDVVVVTTVIDDRAAAERIARELVEARRAACTQVSAEPVTSVFRWKNEETNELEVTTDREWVVTAKTTAAAADACVAAIVALHPYDTPEVLVTPVVGGHVAYLEWVASETEGASQQI